jgi:hypothetical protein
VSLLAGTHRRTAIDQIDTLAKKSGVGTGAHDPLANLTLRRIVNAMRVRRWAASLAAVCSLTLVGASTAAAVPPPVLPHPPPIGATFQLHPDSGPVGTQVTIRGLCAQPVPVLLFGISVQTATGFQNIWIPPEGFPPLKPTPFGVFNVTFTFPSQGNIAPEFGGQGNVPIVPGTYYVGARCGFSGPLLPFQPFTVTAVRR